MNSIQELIDFVESIPEDQWITESYCEHHNITTVKQKACIMGHMNFHLTGDYMKGIFLGSAIQDSEIDKVIKKLQLNERDLKNCNNGTGEMRRYGETPKVRVINFLREGRKSEAV